MTQSNLKILSRLLLVIIIAGLLVTISAAEYRWCPGPDSRTGVCYDWDWIRGDGVCALEYYYYIIHVLTGWNIGHIEFVEAVDPGALATMPPEMYESWKEFPFPMFSMGSVMTKSDGGGKWYREGREHIWISPEGYVFNGDRPSYQYLVWAGLEEYADHLPPAPPGAPFPPPPYTGTPKNTLPLATIDVDKRERTIKMYSDTVMPLDVFYATMVPCPDAISINPRNWGEWDWTPEVKDALSRLGLDPYMGNTRLGYEKSGNTVMMVGMTPSAVMREWNLVRVNGEWTCETATGDELADLLFILEKIGAIEKRGTGSVLQLIAQVRKTQFAERMNTISQSGAAASSLRESTFASRGVTTETPAIPAVSGSSGSAFTTDAARSSGAVRDAWAQAVEERTAQTGTGDSASAFRSDLASARGELLQDYTSRLGGMG